MKIKVYISFLFLLILLKVKAQEIILSQPFAAAQFLSPASVGNGVFDQRIQSNFRSQSIAGSNFAKTIVVGWDRKYNRRTLDQTNYLGIGGQIISTSDGGAIIVGYNTSYGAGGKNVFIAKIGVNDDFPLTNGVPTTYSLVQLEEQLMQDNISMYPNPASSELFLNIPNDLSEIIISTISGQRISGITPQQINNLSVTDTEQNLCKINLDTLESGNYYISIISKTMIVNKMFTIIK